MADIELLRNTDNDITINLIGISSVSSMQVELIRKNTSDISILSSDNGKITLNVTDATMRLNKEMIQTKGIYYLRITVVSGGNTRGLEPSPNFITVV